MISVKSIFVAGVVSLFIVLSSSYTGKATQQVPGDCKQGLKDYLEANLTQLNIQAVDIGNDVITVNIGCYVDINERSISAAIDNYYKSHQECTELHLTVNIVKCSQVVGTLTFKGTMRDSDKPPDLKIRTKTLEKVLLSEARKLGVRVIGLSVDVKEDNKGNLSLLVQGQVSPLKGSASQGKQIFIDLLKKYTGGLNTKANLK